MLYFYAKDCYNLCLVINKYILQKKRRKHTLVQHNYPMMELVVHSDWMLQAKWLLLTNQSAVIQYSIFR